MGLNMPGSRVPNAGHSSERRRRFNTRSKSSPLPRLGGTRRSGVVKLCCTLALPRPVAHNTAVQYPRAQCNEEQSYGSGPAWADWVQVLPPAMSIDVAPTPRAAGNFLQLSFAELGHPSHVFSQLGPAVTINCTRPGHFVLASDFIKSGPSEYDR